MQSPRAQFSALLALVLLVASSLPASAVGRAPASLGDTRERFFGAVQAIYNSDRAAQAGVQWERLIFPWSLIQKNGPTDWASGYFGDQQVAQEAARGIQLVGLAIYTPQWATSTPRTPKPTNVPANLYLAFDDPQNYWGQFMFKLAQRYSGQINTWIIWNEPDMYSDSIQYTWDGTITDLYQLVKVASQAVKKANPEARIALPGLTYWWDKEGGRPLYLERFLEAASHDPTAAAQGDYFDIVDLHQYSNPLNTYVATRVYQRALAAYGLNRPIWIGESNVAPMDDPTGAIAPAFHATLDQQASYIIQTFALARAAGADRMSIYKLVDERPEGPGELYGLVRNDGSVRPAFTAFQTAVRYLSTPTSAVYAWDGSSDPPTDDQITQLIQTNARRTQWVWPAAVNRVTLERGPERVTVVWNASPRLTTGHFPAVAKSAQVVDKFGRDTGEVVAQNGQYQLELQPSSNNTDPRDPSLYLVGGDPRLLVEHVAPLPTAVDAPIQVVWPRDAVSANVTGVLLSPGSTQPVPCRWSPFVRLFASIDGGPALSLGAGAKRLLNQDGLTYPVWDFNAVDISAAGQGKSIDLWLDVNGVWRPAPVAGPTQPASPGRRFGNSGPPPAALPEEPARQAGPLQCVTHPCNHVDELDELERFCEELAPVEQSWLVYGGHYQNPPAGRAGHSATSTHELPPVHDRHHQVKRDQVGRPREHFRQCYGSVLGCVDVEPVASQRIGHQCGNGFVVFDHQHSWHEVAPVTSRARLTSPRMRLRTHESDPVAGFRP